MRFTRLLVGFLIIAGVLWIIVGEQMRGASANAFVNAQLTTLRAPTAGTVSLSANNLGSAVTLGEELAALSDPLRDSTRLNDLSMERAAILAQVASVEAEIETLQAALTDLTGRSDTFTAFRMSELETQLEHARERLALLEAGFEPASPDAGLLDQLLEEGQGGEQGDPRVPGIALEYARERVAVLENALAAANAGVFLGDGFNDAPFSGQRAHDLTVQLESLHTSLTANRARLAATELRLDQERVANARLGGGPLNATANGLIWEILAVEGETVQRGDEVMRLLDCDSTIVTLSVTEFVFNRLEVGNSARFRLTGDERVFDATVIRLAGTGSARIYSNLAVAPGERHLERYDVALLVPGLRADPDLRCAVGRTGRAFFDSQPMDWVRDWWRGVRPE